MPDFKSLKVLIVGAGKMGLNHHQALKSLDVKNIYVYDINAIQLENFRIQIGESNETKFINDLNQIDSNIDFCIIATTADSRFEIFNVIIKLFTLKYLLLEKPISQSLNDANQIFEICSKQNIVVTVNHQMRFLPQYSVIKEFIKDEELGKFVSMMVSGSNIGLSMNIVHYFEAFNWITGNYIEQVISYLQPESIKSPRGPQFEDYAGLVLSFNSKNQKFVADFDSRLGNGIVVIYSFEFGKVIIDELKGEMVIFGRKEEFRGEPSYRYGLNSWYKNVIIMPVEVIISTAQLIKALILGNDYPTPLDSYNAFACVVAAMHSFDKNNQTIDLNSIWGDKNRYPWA
jgi:predicted dehydrogenase